MTKFVQDVLFGLAFGIGLSLAYALLMLIIWFLSFAAGHPPMQLPPHGG